MKDARPLTEGPEPSAARLGPRGFNAGVVDSLGEGFVWINPLDITGLKRLEWPLGLISEASIVITILSLEKSYFELQNRSLR